MFLQTRQNLLGAAQNRLPEKSENVNLSGATYKEPFKENKGII